jgi:DNA invertase Pin-like site-specific DNA recombinase
VSAHRQRCFGYIRVSTAEQDYGAEAQRAEIRAWARRQKPAASVTYLEERASGKTAGAKRPALTDTLARLQRGEAEALVVAKVDRLARSVAHLASILDASQSEGWRLVFLDLGLDTGTPQGRFGVHIMSAMAELEGSMISQRTRDGLEAARASGKKLGRPSTLAPSTRKMIVRLHNEGWARNRIAQRLNEEGIPTAQGGQRWRHSSVLAVLRSSGIDA